MNLLFGVESARSGSGRVSEVIQAPCGLVRHGWDETDQGHFMGKENLLLLLSLFGEVLFLWQFV